MFGYWHRLEKVIKWTGFSVNAFALSIGLKRSENLYQIKKGNNGISRDLAETITKKYPAVSKAWLLTGEGEMLLSAPASIPNAIPYYPTDATMLAQGGFAESPISNISIPFYKEASFAAPYLSDSMAPEIPVGAVIVCKQVEIKSIVPGAIYLLCSESFTGVRYIRMEPTSELLRLEPCNRERYDNLTINSSSISKLFMVVGIIVNKTI